MEFRQAVVEDLPQILDIVKVVVPMMHAANNFQWNEEYPNEEVFRNDISLGQLWVAVDGQEILGVGALTTEQDECYAMAGWDIKEMAMVPHRIAVRPAHQGKGIASSFMRKAYELATERGYKSVRVDTNKMNQNMQKLFKKLGYTFCGEIPLSRKPPEYRFLAFEMRVV